MSLFALDALSGVWEGNVVGEAVGVEDGGMRGGLEANYAAGGKLAAIYIQ